MQSIAQFFSYMNNTDFKYVVLRNWENLPYHVETGPHSDLDLLVYDLEHFLELFPDLERVYPAPRVQFKLHLDNGEYIQLDARYLGDDYYPYEFEENILRTREWNTNGFYTPNPIHHRIGLAYHAVHHKNFNAYPNYLGKLTVKELFETLKSNINISWVEPEDPSVGRFNPYTRGGTSVVSGNGKWVDKKQTRYKRFNLIDNEERMLNLLNSRHFPKIIHRDGETIRIEHCGVSMSASNLPDDWKEQLAEILSELNEHSIIHRDIRLDNLMVKDGVIKLLDFGWARLESDAPDSPPDLLGYPNKCPLGFNDTYSMSRVIKQLEYELEEACQRVN